MVQLPQRALHTIESHIKRLPIAKLHMRRPPQHRRDPRPAPQAGQRTREAPLSVSIYSAPQGRSSQHMSTQKVSRKWSAGKDNYAEMYKKYAAANIGVPPLRQDWNTRLFRPYYEQIEAFPSVDAYHWINHPNEACFPLQEWIRHRQQWEKEKHCFELAKQCEADKFHYYPPDGSEDVGASLKKIRVAAPEAKFGTIPFSPFFDF